jgi:hypothetical protein
MAIKPVPVIAMDVRTVVRHMGYGTVYVLRERLDVTFGRRGDCVLVVPPRRDGARAR